MLILAPLLLASLASASNVGWKSFMKENPTEFHDLPLTWEGKGRVPSWLSGTYVRNGPAQVSSLSSHEPLFRSALGVSVDTLPAGWKGSLNYTALSWLGPR